MNKFQEESTMLVESEYDSLREDVLKSLQNYKSQKMKIKVLLDKTKHNQFFIKIKEKKLRQDLIQKLEEKEIPFIQKKSVLCTSISGISLCCDLLSSNKLDDLIELENEIEKRTVKEFGIDKIFRIEDKDGFKWMALGEKLSNKYYFKSLSDLEETLKNGYVKSSNPIYNIPKWRMPKTYPKNWEFPNTMKAVIEPEDKSPTIIIDGGDELAMALSSSGIPDLLAYAIQATVLYPFFIAVLKIGYDGASDEEKEHRELYDENLEQKKELREILIESLASEIKIKEGLKDCFEKGELCKEKSKVYRLFSALSREGAIRDYISKREGKFSKEEFAKIKEQRNKIDSDLNKEISKETLNNLSDNKFFAQIISNGHKIAQDGLAYATFVDNLAKWKQASDKTFIRKLQRYIETKVLKSGMGLMWTAMAVFEANAIINTLDIAGAKGITSKAVDSVLDITGGILAATGQSAMVVYGASKTYGGIKTVMSLNDWINKINQSEIIDKNTKQLISNYLKSRRVHTILGECVGSSLLSAGQMMMILGGPALGYGSAVTFPGAGITILGVAMTLTNNVMAGKKFTIIDAPSSVEAKILNDFNTIPIEGELQNENQFLQNLKWKANKLTDISKNAEQSLLMMSIYSEIIKNCELTEKPKNNIQLEEFSNKIIKKVQKIYVHKFQDNMKGYLNEQFSKNEIQNDIKKDIIMFYENKAKFYNKITRYIISKQKDDYRKDDFQKDDHLQDDYSKDDYSKDDYSKDDYSKDDYSKDDYSKDDYSKDDYSKDNHLQDDNLKDECTKDNLPKADHPKESQEIDLKINSILDTIRELEDNTLWLEVERKLLKRLVIEKKSNSNIRGGFFCEYIKTINTKNDSMVEIPSGIPNIEMKFNNPIAPKKSKRVYIFEKDKFVEDLKNYQKLPPDKKEVLDILIQNLIYERKNAFGRALITDGNLRMKSNVYRPLWLELPNLIYREQLNKNMMEREPKNIKVENNLLGKSNNKSYEMNI